MAAAREEATTNEHSAAEPQPKDLKHGWTRMDTDFTEGNDGRTRKSARVTRQNDVMNKMIYGDRANHE